jgi:hypothetical protein
VEYAQDSSYNALCSWLGGSHSYSQEQHSALHSLLSCSALRVWNMLKAAAATMLYIPSCPALLSGCGICSSYNALHSLLSCSALRVWNMLKPAAAAATMLYIPCCPALLSGCGICSSPQQLQCSTFLAVLLSRRAVWNASYRMVLECSAFRTVHIPLLLAGPV